jgi:MacB-like periplasmic core domain/FtsX-like permease family
LGGFWQDILYSARALRKRPVLTAVAVLSIAVGIGLNTAIFTLMNGILRRPLPFRDTDRLVAIFSISPEHLDQLDGVSIPDIFDWRQQAHSFEAMGAVVNNAMDFGAEENGMPAERVQGENVTPGALQALGVQPMMGRLISEAEDEVDHPAPVIIISHRLWMRRFGGDKDILQRKILVNGTATSIIGVMPADYRFSNESGDYIAPIPLNHFQLQGSARFLTAVAAVGVYGVMAYSVEQRTREIGIRIALGAARWDVLKLVMRQTLIVTGFGLCVGIAGAAALTRFISSELWEVKPNDPATFAGVSVLLIAIAILACLIPTRRAVGVDPTAALRYE